MRKTKAQEAQEQLQELRELKERVEKLERERVIIVREREYVPQPYPVYPLRNPWSYPFWYYDGNGPYITTRPSTNTVILGDTVTGTTNAYKLKLNADGSVAGTTYCGANGDQGYFGGLTVTAGTTLTGE